jgi:hypothetical protein
MTEGLISIVVPIHDEAENIGPLLRALEGSLRDHPYEILIAYDRDGDTTLPVFEAVDDRRASVRLVRNDLGPGFAHALQAAFREARGDVVVVTMADLSDDPRTIPAMVEKVRAGGATVVSGSRYGKGGDHIGGPWLKRTTSRIAGVSLHYLAGVPTRDSTNSFRAYQADYLRSVEVESRCGFEVALELTVKAHRMGRKVDEVPTTWKDPSAGSSRFPIWRWPPGYLRWYGYAAAAPVFVWIGLLALATTLVGLGLYFNAPIPRWDEMSHVPYVTGDRPVTLEWLWAQHNEHRIPLPKIVYVAVMKTSSLDGRPLRILNAAAMVLMATLGVLAARTIRGRTVYADAFFPLLFLNGAHLENTIWPFQFSFILPGFLMFLVTMLVVHYREERGGSTALLGGLCLVGMVLSSGVGLPPALFVAPWIIRVGVKCRRPAGFAGAALALAAVATVGLYFHAYQTPAHHPPSPGIGASLLEGLMCLSTSMGQAGARIWPYSGIGVLLLLLFVVNLLKIAWWRTPTDRIRSGGLILMLGAIVALALGIGHFRAGLAAGIGFAPRYAAFTSLFLCIAYLGCAIYTRREIVSFLHVVLAALMCTVLWPNMQHGLSHGEAFRHASKMLRQDVRAGRPVDVIASVHWPSWYPDEGLFAEYLRMMARARLSVYRHQQPPDTSTANPLPGDTPAMTAHPPSQAVLQVPAGTRQIAISFGIQEKAYQGAGQSDGVEFRVLLEVSSGQRLPLWSRTLAPKGDPNDRGTQEATIDMPGSAQGPYRLHLETGPGPRSDPSWDWAYWAGVEFRTGDP